MEINIEEIMEEIRNDIKERGLKESELSFSEVSTIDSSDFLYDKDHVFSMNGYMEIIRKINQQWNIPAYIPIQGRGKGIKKIVGKLTNFAIIPRFSLQNDMNMSVTRGFNEMTAYIKMQDETIKKLNERIEVLEEKLKEENK